MHVAGVLWLALGNSTRLVLRQAVMVCLRQLVQREAAELFTQIHIYRYCSPNWLD